MVEPREVVGLSGFEKDKTIASGSFSRHVRGAILAMLEPPPLLGIQFISFFQRIVFILGYKPCWV